MIIHIEAPRKKNDEALIIANALRNGQIGQAKGGLLIKESTDADPRYLLEKLINGDALPPEPLPARNVNWKPEGMVILVGTSISLLGKFEELVPGFTKRFGPICRVELHIEAKKSG